MNIKTKIIIGIIIAVVVIPIGIYTISPLFVSTEIDEPLPSVTESSTDFTKFMEMTGEEMAEAAKQMTQEEQDIIMTNFAQQNTIINENMTINQNQNEIEILFIGDFVGVGDGIHHAEGQAKILKLSDNSNILRLENFKSTNGPDVHLYLSTDKQASDFIDLGSLKANIGNQNYELENDINFTKYNNVLIWCQPFSVLFGSADLQ
ncbi:MAG: DM13 domain-containing protein [Nitrososphaeraceae archaeon]